MTAASAEILHTACALARRLPTSALEQLCTALEQLPPAPRRAEVFAITAALVDKAARTAADEVLASWQQSAPQLSPQTLAWMLRAAAEADAWRQNEQRLEAVWSGPSTPATNLRRTDAALIEVIEAARERLWLVTFAAYRVAPVLAALQRAVARGVKVRFVAESSDENAALTSGGASTLRAALPAAVTIYIWPQEQRAKDENGKSGALHAKFAVADGKVALVSSANLSGHALWLNIEAGTLIEGGEVPSTLEAQLVNLVTEGVLQLLGTSEQAPSLPLNFPHLY